MPWEASPRSRALGVSLFLLAQFACSTPTASPEDQIRQLITRLEEAARDKDLPELKSHISEQYADAEGRDKNALKGLLAYYFLRNRSVHLLTRIQSVQFTAPESAQIRVVTALAGTRIPSAALLPRMRADIYAFEVELQLEDGEWRATRAAWHPATLEDME